MTRDSRGLGDDHVAHVFDQDVQRKIRVGRSVEINGPREALQGHAVAHRDGVALLHPAPADPNDAFFDKPFCPGSTELRHTAGEHHIDPLSCVPLFNLELRDRHLPPPPTL